MLVNFLEQLSAAVQRYHRIIFKPHYNLEILVELLLLAYCYLAVTLLTKHTIWWMCMPLTNRGV